MTEQNPNAVQPADTAKPLLPVWGPGQTVGLGLAIFMINVGVQTAVLIVMAFKEFSLNPGQDIIQFTNDLASNGTLIAIATIISAAVSIAITIVFVKARRRAPVREYLAFNPLTKKQVLISLAILIGLIGLMELLSTATGQTPDTGFNFNVYQTADPVALLWIAFVIFGPAFEEIFFRGFLFAGWLNSRLRPAGTIAITSILWAVLHVQYDIYGMLQILILGIVFGIMRYKTRSIWSPLLMHFAWNLTGMISIALTL